MEGAFVFDGHNNDSPAGHLNMKATLMALWYSHKNDIFSHEFSYLPNWERVSWPHPRGGCKCQSGVLPSPPLWLGWEPQHESLVLYLVQHLLISENRTNFLGALSNVNATHSAKLLHPKYLQTLIESTYRGTVDGDWSFGFAGDDFDGEELWRALLEF